MTNADLQAGYTPVNELHLLLPGAGVHRRAVPRPTHAGGRVSRDAERDMANPTPNTKGGLT